MSDEIATYSQELLRYRLLIIDARNRLVAHLDRKAVMAGRPLGAHPEQEVKLFFANLSGYVDAVGNAVGVGPLDFRTSAAPGDATDLLRTLRRALMVLPEQ